MEEIARKRRGEAERTMYDRKREGETTKGRFAEEKGEVVRVTVYERSEGYLDGSSSDSVA